VILFLVLAVSRPQSKSTSKRIKTSRGIDIVMVIDISSSMLSKDLKPDRLTALKNVASNFIDDRPNDRIGLVVYAAESYTKTPVTTDKLILKQSLSEINYESLLEDGTAIGMGLSTAVNRLKESTAKSKVIILLTDGVNNSGFIDPRIAAELAAEYEIKTYTIGLGTNGMALAPVSILPNGNFQFSQTKVEIDEDLLRYISEKTSGRYFRATDNLELQNIYDEINKLEKTEITETIFTNVSEKYRPFVLIGLIFFIIEIIARKTIFKSFV
jgi:Ca-activated chloride channel family protein